MDLGITGKDILFLVIVTLTFLFGMGLLIYSRRLKHTEDNKISV